MAESPRGPSRTALLTAVARGATRYDSFPSIFDDDLALELAGDEGSVVTEILRSQLHPILVAAFGRWVSFRSRYTENLVELAIGKGINQYVILGAGLDSFVYRRRDLQDRLRVFEVDHPESQAWKIRRLEELEITRPDNLVYAAVDFERQSLQQGLMVAGFDFSRAAVFSWIGVTMYLTLDSIEATLATIAHCPTGSALVLTYNQPLDELDELSIAVTTGFMAIAREVGEPFVSLFVPAQIDGLLRRHGFDDIVDLGPDEGRRLYFEGRDELQIAGAQRLIAANVSRPGP